MKPRPPHARPAAPRPRALRPEPLACAGARGRGGAGRLSPAPGAFLFFTLKPRLRSLLCTEVALGQPARSQQDQAPGAGAGAAGRRRLRSLRRARPGRPSLLGLESGRWRRRRPPGEVGRAGRAGRAVGVWARWAQGSRPWGPSGCPAAGHWGPGGVDFSREGSGAALAAAAVGAAGGGGPGSHLRGWGSRQPWRPSRSASSLAAAGPASRCPGAPACVPRPARLPRRGHRFAPFAGAQSDPARRS